MPHRCLARAAPELPRALLRGAGEKAGLASRTGRGTSRGRPFWLPALPADSGMRKEVSTICNERGPGGGAQEIPVTSNSPGEKPPQWTGSSPLLRGGVDKWARGVWWGWGARGVRSNGPGSLPRPAGARRGPGWGRRPRQREEGTGCGGHEEELHRGVRDFPLFAAGCGVVGEGRMLGWVVSGPLGDVAPVGGVQRRPGSQEQWRPPHSACVALELGRGPW